ncbi:hypothetical protein HMSSN036_39710 [Paenibacillus macerans]|nr:hypothetical protein HMSSN036_39710 [Paenibacillus macerans]
MITVDMGGTSYDVSVIENLQPALTTESWISRYRVALPMLDIHTVGAGGGSIAWIDAGGMLRVGPRSAGSTRAGVLWKGRYGTDRNGRESGAWLHESGPFSWRRDEAGQGVVRRGYSQIYRRTAWD